MINTVIRINAQVPLECKPSGSHWIAKCDPLKLTLQAETYGELMEDFALTLDAMMRDLFESGELDRFMRQHGWTFVGTGLLPAQPLKDVRFDVPFIPALMAPNGSERIVHQQN
jgi:hypothetical protein